MMIFPKYTWHEILFSSGDVFLPQRVRDFLGTFLYKSPNFVFYIQWWTIVHFINGIIFGFLYLYLGYSKQNYYISQLVIHTLWEMWQVFIGMSKPWMLSGRNSLVDTMVDTSVYMIGAFVAYKIFGESNRKHCV